MHKRYYLCLYAFFFQNIKIINHYIKRNNTVKSAYKEPAFKEQLIVMVQMSSLQADFTVIVLCKRSGFSHSCQKYVVVNCLENFIFFF